MKGTFFQISIEEKSTEENEISPNENDEIIPIEYFEENSDEKFFDDINEKYDEVPEIGGEDDVENIEVNEEKDEEKSIQSDKAVHDQDICENDDDKSEENGNEMRSDNENTENEDDEDILSLYGSGDDDDGISLIPDEGVTKRTRLETVSKPKSVNRSEVKVQHELDKVGAQPPSERKYKIPKKKRPELFAVESSKNIDSTTDANNSIIQKRVSIKSRLGVIKDMNPKSMDPRSTRKNQSLVSMQKASEVKQVVNRPVVNLPPAIPSLLSLPILNDPFIEPSTSQSKSIAKPYKSSTVELPLPSFRHDPLCFDSPFGLLIGKTCHLFLHDSCRTPNCQYNHFLPSNQIFRKQLDVIGLQHAIDTYDTFIIRTPKLFARFFPDFCDFFTAHKQESKLLEMVMDCSHPLRRLQNFLVYILDGLCQIGIEYSVAVERIIAELEVRTTPINSILLKLVLDERNKNLVLIETTLKKIAENPKYIFSNDTLVRLINLAIETNAQEIIHLVWMLLSLHPDRQKVQLSFHITRFMEFIRDQTLANLP